MKNAFILAVVIAELMISVSSVQAYPSVENLIPTADIQAAKTFKIAYESDGKAEPFQGGRTQYFYTELGFGGRLEAGLDFYDPNGDRKNVLNAKYLLVPESKQVPALAAGVMNVAHGYDSIGYVVGTKSFGPLRFHLGGASQDRVSFALLGTDYAVTKTVSLIADYEGGDERYGTLGICWQATPDVCFSLYGARVNERALKDNDYVGFFLSYSIPIK